MKQRLFTALAAFLAITALLPSASVLAVSGNQFNSGRIIDDSIFTNRGTMGVSDIQNFLNGQVPSCDTNGTQIYSGSETRAQYSESKGYNPPYTCLKDYATSIPSIAGDAYCSAFSSTGNVSSAQIIYQVAQNCGINPQVLLVLLQKEQGLVTDSWPWPIEYQQATGYGCPASGCNPAYAGLFNQLYRAARQFKIYQSSPGVYSYQGGLTSNVLYSPAAGCGSSAVGMSTNATADLYNYTPYQPNAAALANLQGSGDGCSSYGNRNFWVFFNNWFGPTTSSTDTNILSFIHLNDPSGNVQAIGYSSISAYSFAARTDYAAYPAVPNDSSVIPLYNPTNGNLAFVRLNHSSGHAELVQYSAASGFKQMVDYSLTGYPAVTPDGSVIPLFNPAGDLSFIRLNYASGRVQVVNYSASSNFTRLDDNTVTGYPAVAPNSGVIPLYKPNSDLSFIRLNHGSGQVENVTYSASSNYNQLADYTLTGYPAVAPNSGVIPLYQPNGDLNFIRMNYSGGDVQLVGYSAGSDYKTMNDYTQTGYPSVSDGSVIPLFTR